MEFQVNHEKHIKEILKSLKSAGSLSVKQYTKIKVVGSGPGVLHGLCKIHKTIIDVCPTVRLVLSATGRPTYKIAKFLVPTLGCLTIKEFTVKNSFSFAKESVEQDSSFYMGRFYVESLFINIPLEETINICTESI